MPCFASIRRSDQNRAVFQRQLDNGRNAFRFIHRRAGLLFSSVFFLVLMVALQQDGYINVDRYVLYLPSLIILWPAAVLWCCGVMLEVGDFDGDDKSLLTACAFPQTLLAIVFTLLAFEAEFMEGGSPVGTKMVPIFVCLGLMMAATLLICTEVSSGLVKLGSCAFLSFATSMIVTIARMSILLDRGWSGPNYGDPSPDSSTTWFSVFLPSFIFDIFILIFLWQISWKFCTDERGMTENDSLSFALTVVGWLLWLSYVAARVLFIMREDHLTLYFTLGNVGGLKRRDTYGSLQAVVVAAPLLFVGLYFCSIDCTSRPTAKCADSRVEANFQRVEAKRQARADEKQEMDNARVLGRRVGVEMSVVATSAEEIKTNEATSGNKKTGTENEDGDAAGRHGGVDGDGESDDVVVDIRGVHVDDGEEVTLREFARLLQRLEACETTPLLISTLQILSRFVGDHSELKTKERKREVCTSAKMKRARNDELWTSDVAVEFHNVLEQFSLLTAMGLHSGAITGGLRTISKQLRNPFKRQNSSREENEEKEDEKEEKIII